MYTGLPRPAKGNTAMPIKMATAVLGPLIMEDVPSRLENRVTNIAQ